MPAHPERTRATVGSGGAGSGTLVAEEDPLALPLSAARKPCCSAEIPAVINGDLACIAIEGFAVCRIQSNELKRTDGSMDVVCTI